MERVMTITSHGSDQTMQNEKDLFFNIIKTNRLYVHALPNSLATTAFGCIIQLQNRELVFLASNAAVWMVTVSTTINLP